MTAISVRPPSRRLTVEDVLAAVKTLDEAAGADANYFRWRLREWVRTQEQLAERRSQAEVGRD